MSMLGCSSAWFCAILECIQMHHHAQQSSCGRLNELVNDRTRNCVRKLHGETAFKDALSHQEASLIATNQSENG